MSKMMLLIGFLVSLLQFQLIHAQPEAKAVSVMSISGQNPSVMEGDTFNLSVSIDAAPTLSDFVVVIRNNTPEIQELNVMVTFPMSNDIPPEQIVPNVLVVEDNIFEPTLDLFGVEMLTLDITYNGTTSSEMQLGSIIISGDTAVNIGFVQPSYTVLEGNSVMVCVMIAEIIADPTTDLTATITGPAASAPAQDGVASVGDFNLGGQSGVTFNSMTENNMECATVNTLTDALVENIEILDLTLTASTPLVVLQDQNTTQIYIIDANATCGPPPNSTDAVFMVDVSQPSIMDGDTLVANDGAVASYSCVDGYMLDGEISTLECVAMNDTVNLVWYPSAPSACVEIVETEAPTDDDDEETTQPAPTTDAGVPTVAGVTLLTLMAVSLLAALL